MPRDAIPRSFETTGTRFAVPDTHEIVPCACSYASSHAGDIEAREGGTALKTAESSLSCNVVALRVGRT